MSRVLRFLARRLPAPPARPAPAPGRRDDGRVAPPGDSIPWASSVARALVPVVCPGCATPDVRWCGDCSAPWWEEPFRAEAGAGRLDVLGRAPLPVFSIAPLVGPAHLMVSAWKDGGRRDLDAFFAEAMDRAIATLADSLVPVTVVVPVPSRASSERRRGADLPGILAMAASAAITGAGRRAPVAACLRNSGGESRGRGVRARWSAGAGALRVVSPPVGDVALLVDDVVTTGASLARAADALERAGVAVAAAATLAATPAPGTSVPEVR